MNLFFLEHRNIQLGMMMNKFKINRLPEFEKDLKAIKKKFRTIESDLENTLNFQLALAHIHKIDNKGVFRLENIDSDELIYKIKKFACRALKGKGGQSGIRVIYAYNEKDKSIDLIEIYYKGDQVSENRERIKKYLKEIKNGEKN